MRKETENKKLQLPRGGWRGEASATRRPLLSSPEARAASSWSPSHVPARSRSPARRPGGTRPVPGVRPLPLPPGRRRGGGPEGGEGGPAGGEGGHAPNTAGVRPVSGHARGQQQGRHGLIEEEVVVDELLLLRLGHALEGVVAAGQVPVQAGQSCRGARSGDTTSPGPHARPASWEPRPGGGPRPRPLGLGLRPPGKPDTARG